MMKSNMKSNERLLCRRSTFLAAALGACAGLVCTFTEAGEGPQRSDVYVRGSQGYHTYRIPAVVLTDQGTLLAFCEARKNSKSDSGDIDLVLKRSRDFGKTWGPMRVVHEEGGSAPVTIGNPCPVVDIHTRTIWLSFSRNNDRVFVTKSTDDGTTWTPPTEITKDVKKPRWDWYATGPGHGIQTVGGRLLIPCDHTVRGIQASSEAERRRKSFHSHVFYSDDHGETWKLGGSVESPGNNECEVVELDDGSLLLSMRHFRGPKRRAMAVSPDGGLTWSEAGFQPDVYCPGCQASMVSYSRKSNNKKTPILHSGPTGGGPWGRNNLTVRLSYDEGKTWPVAQLLHDGAAAYSDLIVFPDGTIGCLYEQAAAHDVHASEKLTFARFTLDWLTSGRDGRGK